MADQVLTKQKLINADEDLGDLEEVLNGPPGKLIKTRLGREVYTLSSIPIINTMTRHEINTALSNLSTNANKYYATLAAANADIANIAINQSVTIGESGANSGLWYKATSGSTSLTKSDYDPLTQAKNYTDVNFPKNRTDIVTSTDIVSLQQVGEYLVPPSIELTNAPTGRTSSREAVLSVSGVGTANRYRKQEYSESVTGKRWFQIIDTLNNTVRRAWTDVSLAGQNEIVSSLSHRELCRVVSARASTANSYTQEARDSGLFKGLIQGEIVYDSVNRKVHTPANIVIYDSLDTSYTVSEAQSIGTTETDFGTHNMFMLYLDKSDLTFKFDSYRTALTDAQKLTYILCAVIRHDLTRLTITCDGIFRIDYAQYGEIISKQYCDVFSGGTRTLGNLPNYDSTAHTLTLKNGSVLKFGNITQAITSDTVISANDPVETSTTVIIYWNLATGELVVRKYNTNLPIAERFRFVKLATVKDGAMLGSIASGYDVVSVSINSSYTVDDVNPFAPPLILPYKSMVRYVNVDDTVRAVNHGGFKSVAPANSLEGYTASKAAGFKYVECDVKFTSDGVPILMHDETVDRTTDGTGAVREMTLAQIKELKIVGYPTYPDCRVPTLEEFLRHCHKLNLHPYIEWSEVDSVPTDTDASLIAQIIRRTGMDGKVSLISMRTNKLAAVCKFMPHLRCGFTSSSVPDVARLTAVLKEINVESKGQNEIFYNCSQVTLTQEHVNNCHDFGVGCEAWVVEDPAKVLELASWGVTGISTDSLNIRAILDE